MPAKSAQRTAKRKTSSTRPHPSNKGKVRSKSRNKVFKKNAKRILATFCLTLFCSLALLGYLGYRKISQQFVSADSVSSRITKHRDVKTVLVASVKDFDSNLLEIEDISVFVFDTQDLQVTKIDIDEDIEIDMPGKFSTESLSKALILGDALYDETSQKVKPLVQSMKKLLGYNIDNYVLCNHEDCDLIVRSLTDHSIRDFVFVLWNSTLRTDLVLSEFYDLYSFTTGLSGNAHQYLEVKNAKDAFDLADTYFRDITFNSQVSQEKKSISVLNATDVPGVAAFGARVVGNMGGHVVAANNSVTHTEESVLIVDDMNSATLEKIAKYFDIKKVYLKTDQHGFFNNEIDRSDVTLILGFDIQNVL